VRPSVIFVLLLVSASAATADTIHLKNGRKIWADHVHENGTHIEYDVGESSFAIPKSVVERIEAGGVPPEIASVPGNHGDLPAFVPNEELASDADLPSKVIREGHVDKDALNALESNAKPQTVAAAYFIAGKHELESGNLPQARSFLETALRFQGDSPTILNYYAVVLSRMGMMRQALSYAQRSAQLAPTSADSFAVLGFVQYASDKTREAIQSWKHSLELRPDPAVETYLAKAQRELKAEAEFTERASLHFTLHYEGHETSDTLRRAILATLESAYTDLSQQLGISPRENISVFLFTNQAFFDVTQAPSWSAALNDGKLRIPVQGVETVTPDLARVLKHELAHSFINQASHGRCPQWLHEGIAQVIEPRTVGGSGRQLGRLFTSEREIPLNMLEGSFVRFSSLEANLAYAESLAAAEYINESYGMSDLRRILERLGEGSPTEVALRSVIHSDYAHLQAEIGRFLTSKYGS
jgi:tetratricopeptide (TPR) repeat protein